jgi:hypothetical protein
MKLSVDCLLSIHGALGLMDQIKGIKIKTVNPHSSPPSWMHTSVASEMFLQTLLSKARKSYLAKALQPAVKVRCCLLA